MAYGIKNIIFDIGNVLFDYRWQQMLQDYGLEQEEALRVGREMFDDPRHLWHEYDLATYSREELIREFAKEWPKDAVPIAWFIRHGEYMTVPRPKVWDKVHALKKKGFHLYLLSNYPEELFYRHTEYADFMQDMDGYVISFQYHLGKPDRAIYDKLCTLYGLQPQESLFFDDRVENIRGASDFGMQARLVTFQEGLLQDLDHLLQDLPLSEVVGTDTTVSQQATAASQQESAKTKEQTEQPEPEKQGLSQTDNIGDGQDSPAQKANLGDRETKLPTPRAAQWIKKLQMEPHPEGGWFREIYHAAETCQEAMPGCSSEQAASRSLAGSIYFLLNQDEISHFHVIDCDEIWYFHEGGGVELYLLGEDGSVTRRFLGTEEGMEPMVVIPKGIVFGAQNINPHSYTLMSCATIPAFQYEGFRLVTRAELAGKYPSQDQLIQRMAF